MLPAFSFCQSYIKGTVTDLSGIPVRLASVSIIEKQSEIGLDFNKTNENGEYYFVIPDSVSISGLAVRVNAIGFLKSIQSINQKNSIIDFVLVRNGSELPPVTVKSNVPRITVKGDTLNFSASAFTDKGDRVIGDVIKKLPGIEVEENGTIKYQGKPINYFYIDGDNILDDKYTIATKNIPSDIVEKIQVIENNQHIKMLNGVVGSERAALNITLKNNAKINLINTAKAGIGVSDLLEGELNSMAFKNRFKAINILKYNNIGSDPSDDVISHNASDLSNSLDNRGTDNLLALGIAGIPNNIPKKFYLFNQAGLFSVNDLVKLKNDLSIRINAYYMADRQNQSYKYFSNYYLPRDTITYNENQQIKHNPKVLHATVSANMNTTTRYFNNSLSIDYNTSSDESSLVTSRNSISQSLRNSLHKITNSFNSIKLIGSDRFIELYSFGSYEEKPQELTVFPGLHEAILNKNNGYLQAIQKVNTPVLFLNNYISFKAGNGQFLQTYKAGILYQAANLKSDLLAEQFNNSIQSVSDSFTNHLSWRKTKFYEEANFRWEGTNTIISFSLPAGYSIINYEDTFFQKTTGVNRILASPAIRFQNKIGKENMLNVSYQYNTQLSNMNQIYRGIVMNNYQSFISNDVPVTQTRNNTFNAGLDLKRSIKLLFINMFYTYSERQSDFIYSSTLQNSIMRTTIVPISNKNFTTTLSVNISKYLFSFKTTVFFKYTYQYTRLQQLQNSILFPTDYSSHNLIMNAVIKPARFLALNYESSFKWTSSRVKEIVGDVSNYYKNYYSRQQMEVNVFSKEKFSLKSRTEVYLYNQPDRKKASFLFSDASIRFNLNKNIADIELVCSNLFNTTHYEILSAEDNNIYGTNYLLRPRTIMLKMTFRF